MMNKKQRTMTFLGFALAMLLAATGAAYAADAPLAIDHAAVSEAVSDTVLPIEASVSGGEGARRVTLFVRSQGAASYYAIPMALEGAVYRGVVPANLVTVGALEYYIEAMDEAGAIVTAPAADARNRPYPVSVERDATMPDVVLRSPSRAVGDQSFLVALVLEDEGQNIDPDSVRIIFNGRDVTSQARITPRSATFTAQATDVTVFSTIQVSVQDRAGNEVTRRFRIYKLPSVEGGVNLAYSSKRGFRAAVDAAAAWGPFSVQARLESDDPALFGGDGQPTSAFQLAYDSRILDFQLGDVAVSLSPMTANDYKLRGYNASLDLGLFKTRVGSGLSVRETPDTYARRFLGLRQEVNLWISHVAVNLAQVVDVDRLGLASNPEQNYVVSVDAGFDLFGLEADLEIAGSVYFPNARGNLWDTVDKLNDLPEPFDQVADIVSRVPAALRGYLPLPSPESWLLDLPYVDVGTEVRVKAPLPWSSLEARYFRNGPDFRTLAATAEADREGFGATFSTARLFNRLQFNAGVRSYEDNVQSLLRLAVGDPAPTKAERNHYEVLDGSASLRLGGVTVRVDAERKETNRLKDAADLPVAQAKNKTDTIGVRLSDIRFSAGSFDVKSGGSVTRATFEDLKNPLNDKVTTTAKVTLTASRAPFVYDLGYTHKLEEDAAGATVNAPSVSAGVVWTKRNATLAGIDVAAVRATAKASLGQSRGPGQDLRAASYNLQLRVDPTTSSRLTFDFKARTRRDDLKDVDRSDSEFTVSYSLSF